MRATLPILLALAATAIAPSHARADAVTIPPPTGHYRVGTTTTALTDASRREPLIRASRPRSIVAGLWYPTAGRRGRTAPYLSPAVARQIGAGIPGGYRALAGARTEALVDAPILHHAGGWPVLVFSPGYGTGRQLYTGLVEDLAAQGFVVVAVDHPEDANVVTFPDGHTVVRPDVPETPTTIREALAVRVADVRFLLDQLEARPAIAAHGPRRADLDLSRIGMLGHSLGGATAANAMLTDPRILAGADLDGTIYGAAGHAGLSRPFLIATGPPGPDREKGTRGFLRRLRGPRVAVTFAGARHFAFSDLLFVLPQLVRTEPALAGALGELIGHLPPGPTLARERRCLAAFFDRFVKGRPAATSAACRRRRRAPAASPSPRRSGRGS